MPTVIPLLDGLAQQLADFQQAQQPQPPIKSQRYSMVSFHQAYGYEEFVEGIRPVMAASDHTSNSSSQMSYAIQDGAFLKLCQRAANDPEQRYALLIDEINRANVSRVFGELLSLIEPDKRTGQPNAMQVNLAYSGRAFSVPANVDIYATMNTQDHSLAPLDMALRRRFRFIDCPPQPELLPIIRVSGHALERLEDNESSETINLATLLAGLNRRISQTLGQEAQLGHAFLFSVQNLPQLQTVLIEQIIPQLAQAAGGQVDLLQYLFNDEQQPAAVQFIHDSQSALSQKTAMNNQNSMFTGQNTFLGSTMPGMSAGGYMVNPDLVARRGEFTQPFVYQRLY